MERLSMIYTFKCEKCQKFMEFENSINLGPPKLEKCPICGDIEGFDRTYEVPLMVFDNTPKTVGSLAERNTLIHKSQINESKDKNSKKIEVPWEKLDLKSVKNIPKYIETGNKQ